MLTKELIMLSIIKAISHLVPLIKKTVQNASLRETKEEIGIDSSFENLDGFLAFIHQYRILIFMFFMVFRDHPQIKINILKLIEVL